MEYRFHSSFHGYKLRRTEGEILVQFYQFVASNAVKGTDGIVTASRSGAYLINFCNIYTVFQI